MKSVQFLAERVTVEAQPIAGDQHGGEHVKATEAFGDRTVPWIDQDFFREDHPVPQAQRQLGSVPLEGPALAPGTAPGQKGIDAHQRRAWREGDLRTLVVPGTGETHRRIGQNSEKGIVFHLGDQVAATPARRAIHSSLALRGEHRGGALADSHFQPDPVAIHQATAQGARIGPGRVAVISRREDAQRAWGIGAGDHGPVVYQSAEQSGRWGFGLPGRERLLGERLWSDLGRGGVHFDLGWRKRDIVTTPDSRRTPLFLERQFVAAERREAYADLAASLPCDKTGPAVRIS